jgi:hypothetical protein
VHFNLGASFGQDRARLAVNRQADSPSALKRTLKHFQIASFSLLQLLA